MISTQILNFIDQEVDIDKLSLKDDFRNKLVNLGYTIQNEHVNKTLIWNLSNQSQKINIVVKECNNDKLWYTFNPTLEDTIDFAILLFYNHSKKKSFVILDRNDFTKISNMAPKMSYGRFNVRLSESNNTIKETQSLIDLTETLNSFAKLTSFVN